MNDCIRQDLEKTVGRFDDIFHQYLHSLSLTQRFALIGVAERGSHHEGNNKNGFILDDFIRLDIMRLCASEDAGQIVRCLNALWLRTTEDRKRHISTVRAFYDALDVAIDRIGVAKTCADDLLCKI